MWVSTKEIEVLCCKTDAGASVHGYVAKMDGHLIVNDRCYKTHWGWRVNIGG